VEVALQCAELKIVCCCGLLLDGRTLLEIAKVLKVHEATVSRS